MSGPEALMEILRVGGDETSRSVTTQRSDVDDVRLQGFQGDVDLWVIEGGLASFSFRFTSGSGLIALRARGGAYFYLEEDDGANSEKKTLK